METPDVAVKFPNGAVAMMDIWNALYRQRMLFLPGPVDDQVANSLTAVMLHLDKENNKDITFWFNTEGGEVAPCLALYDTMKHIKCDVSTIGFGGVYGMACFLMAMGTPGKRGAYPHTSLMLHQPSGVARGQASDIFSEGRELQKVRSHMVNVLAQQTRQEPNKIARDLKFTKYFSAEAALDYGLIDKVLYRSERKLPGQKA